MTHASVPGQSGSGGSETQNFCYDEQNRLVWAGNSGTQPSAGNGTCGSGTLSNTLGGAAYSSSFAYTHLGQLWQGPLNGSGATQQYLYCDSTHPHQLKGLYPTGTTCSNPTGATYSSQYDAWGNVTSRTYNGTAATLSYDTLDHLTQWNAGSNSQQWYAYDASGNRVVLRSTTASGTSITTYAFGLEEHSYDASGNSTNNTYYYMLGGRLIGELTGKGTLVTQFFLTDTLGSVLATFNATAGSVALQGNQVYGPYGNSLYKQGSIGTSKGFTGQYSDATGLDYYNARYYDPIVGLFISVDTVQSNLQGFNPYAYVSGNPETTGDSTGHCDSWCVGVDIGINVLSVADPLIGLGSALSVADTYASAYLQGASAPTTDQIASARLKGAIYGGLLTIGTAGGVACIIVQCEPGVALAWFGAGYGADTFATTFFGNTIQSASDKFYRDHTAVDQVTNATEPRHPSFVPPVIPQQGAPSNNSPTPSTRPTSSAPHPPSRILPKPGKSSIPTASGTNWSYYTVASGDSLWAIAARFYGSGYQWQSIYQSNRGTIGNNPNLIYPGERLAIKH